MKKIMPPTIFYAFAILIAVLYFVFPIKRIIPFPYNYFGWLLIWFGIFINIWAWAIFRKKQTTLNPFKKPTKFDVSGPFKFTRNPMYLGMTLVLLGMSICFASLSTFIFPILYIIIIKIYYIPFEEKTMEKEFGKKYLDYKKKVRRWI